jgi:phosphoribosylaminoimidazole synthetase/phosphoribosylamine--glycine ligase
MNILILGSGGREHAICKALLYDKVKLFCISETSNPFIDLLTETYLTFDVTKNLELLYQCIELWNIKYVVVGPEKYLQNKIVDKLQKIVPCIGPTYDFAKIELDKSFCREFFFYNGLQEYLPHFSIVNKKDELNKKLFLNDNSVIKPSGLCSGKGVKIIGEHLDTIEAGINYCKEILDKEQTVVIEEKLVGKEFSLMSFCDGVHLKHLPLVQDFKRLNEYDKGPNTGSMGSVSYSDHKLPFLSDEDIENAKRINENVIKILNEHKGCVGYRGILYGSFMKTKTGIKIIEYNARFGDPECINILYLLDNTCVSLNTIFLSIIKGKLNDINIKFKNENTVCKYLVNNDYPYKKVVESIKLPLEALNYDFFISSVSKINNNYFTNGSRILALIKTGEFTECCNEINDVFEKYFSDFYWRKDIGQNQITYKGSGVDIDEGTLAVQMMKPHIKKTFNRFVVDNYGDFGGVYNLSSYLNLNKYDQPMLVSSTDGVGTKTRFIKIYNKNKISNLGRDIVNHSINDILVKGAIPLFFLDYLAYNKLNSKMAETIVSGMSDSCVESNCVLIGGETAEMASVYRENEFDIAGTIVGIVDQKNIIDGKKNINEGNIVIGLPARGLHTNGYSLILKILEVHKNHNKDLLDEETLNYLSYYHKSYLKEIMELRKLVSILGLCHITGGGLIENPKRILREDLSLYIDTNSWDLPKIYEWIQKYSNLELKQLYKIFNCGIGMLIVIDKKDKVEAMNILNNYGGFLVGTIKKREENSDQVIFF